MVVDAAHQHGVDLDRRQPGRRRRPSSRRARRQPVARVSTRTSRGPACRGETLTRSSPAAASGRRGRSRPMPFVVMRRSRARGAARRCRATSVGRPRRSSGSPPVSRTSRTPRPTATPIDPRTISSSVSISGLGTTRAPRPACSRCSAGCTGRSPRPAGPRATRPNVSGMLGPRSGVIGRLLMTTRVGRVPFLGDAGDVFAPVADGSRRRDRLRRGLRVPGRWQWHRHDAKVARADRINSHYYARPMPLRSALPTTGETLPRNQEWTKVTATGTMPTGTCSWCATGPTPGSTATRWSCR